MKILIVLLALTYISLSSAKSGIKDAETFPTLAAPQGQLIGMTNYSRDGRPYYSFFGVPFGKSKRFLESEPADSWKGIRDATKFGAACLQYNNYLNYILGSEDCLFLNVYTPQLPSSDNPVALPVMVFIHGGSFVWGSGSDYGGKYLMDEDIIPVTINYRLGPFGWVDTAYGANLGLKDQTLSLEWVRDNIRSFGGDPNSVTIFGESAGSGSVGLHILSPLSRGLFLRAISESAVPLSNGVFIDGVREFRKLGSLMDCPTGNRRALTECLEAMDGIEMLTRIKFPILIPGLEAEDIPRFAATVDKNSAGKVFLPDTPINLLVKGDFNRVPWIAGGNSHEGLTSYIDLALSEPLRDELNSNWNENAPTLFGYKAHNCEASNGLREFYLDNQPIGSPETLQNFTNLATDRAFLHSTEINAQLHSNFAPAYMYYFSLRGPATFDQRWSWLNVSTDGLTPAAHGDELQYLFHVGLLYPEIAHGTRFESFSDWFVKLWVSFATDGTVSNDWNPVTFTTDKWYQIDSVSGMVNESVILGERMKFLENLFPFKLAQSGAGLNNYRIGILVKDTNI